MKLTWYGTAALILEEKNTVIAFDPFSGLPMHSLSFRRGSYRNNELFSPLPLPHEADFRRATHVFITHGHFDHIYHLPRLYFEARTRICGTSTPLNKLKAQGMNPKLLRRIEPGWKGNVGPFVIHAFQGRHCKFDQPLIKSTLTSKGFFRHPVHLLKLLRLNLSYKEAGETLFYEVRVSDMRIQIMGSMNLDENTKYPTGADILILPLQGRSDQDTYALQFVEQLKPKMVLLDHFDNSFPPVSATIDTSGFIRNVEEKFMIPCRELKKGETIDYE